MIETNIICTSTAWTIGVYMYMYMYVSGVHVNHKCKVCMCSPLKYFNRPHSHGYNMNFIFGMKEKWHQILYGTDYN